MNRETKIKLAKELRAAGLPLREIGAMFGVTHQMIRRWTDETTEAKYREQKREYMKGYQQRPEVRAKDRMRKQQRRLLKHQEPSQ
jgi:hypothetical protein